MSTPSEIVQRILGTHIEDDQTPKPPLHAWIQAECRVGCFKIALEDCSKEQPEMLRVDLTLVECADPEKIVVRVPGVMVDHESLSPFETEVLFEINPATGAVKRR